MERKLRDEDYRELLRLRTGLRRFLHQSESFARAAGLTPAQHQLLLAVRGHDEPEGPTIGDVADYLLLRHHSAVELIDRAVAAGLLSRVPDAHDARMVRLALTPRGEDALERLSEENLEELARLADRFRPLWHGLDDVPMTRAPADAERTRPAKRRRPALAVSVGRVDDAPDDRATTRILIDPHWPRGLPREGAPFHEWLPDVAPSSELRRFYRDRPDRFDSFRERYLAELETERANAVADLIERAKDRPLELVTAANDIEHSAASVLADELCRRLLRTTSRKR